MSMDKITLPITPTVDKAIDEIGTRDNRTMIQETGEATGNLLLGKANKYECV